MHDLGDLRAVGARVVDAATIDVARPRLAEVGEPEPAVRIEDDVVGTAQAMLADAIVEHVDATGLEVDAFDPPAAIVGGLERRRLDVAVAAPFEAAVVADVAGAVRSDRGAIGAAARAGDDARLAAARIDAGQGAAADLDHQQRSVGRDHRSFRKFQSFGEDLHRAVSSVSSWCPRLSMPGGVPARARGSLEWIDAET